MASFPPYPVLLPFTPFTAAHAPLAPLPPGELPSGDWTLSGGRIQWNDHHSQLSCLFLGDMGRRKSSKSCSFKELNYLWLRRMHSCRQLFVTQGALSSSQLLQRDQFQFHPWIPSAGSGWFGLTPRWARLTSAQVCQSHRFQHIDRILHPEGCHGGCLCHWILDWAKLSGLRGLPWKCQIQGFFSMFPLSIYLISMWGNVTSLGLSACVGQRVSANDPCDELHDCGNEGSTG